MRTHSALVLLAVVFSLAMAAVASAAWTGLGTQGATNNYADESCASPSADSVVCAARGLSNTLVVSSWTAGVGWAGWTTIAGVVTSAPSCAADDAGHVICAVRNAASALVYARYNGTTWSAARLRQDLPTHGRRGASFAAGKVLCATRSLTRGLISTAFDGTTWDAFKTIASATTSDPGCG